MLHNLLIAVHAVAAIVSLVAGSLVVFVPRHSTERRLFSVYLWSLAAMVGSLLAAITVGWQQGETAQHIVFAGLSLLALFMMYRAMQARQLLEARPSGWRGSYVDHIGFTLISLLEGFIIVSAIRLGMSWWIIAFGAIAILLLGRWAIEIARSRLRQVLG